MKQPISVLSPPAQVSCSKEEGGERTVLTMGSGSTKEVSAETNKKGIAAGLKKTGGALKEVKEGKTTVSILNGNKSADQASLPNVDLPNPTPVLA